MMADSTPPSSLRKFLDEAGDVAALGDPFVGWLAEAVVADRALYGFNHLARWVQGRQEKTEHREEVWADIEARDPGWVAFQRDAEETFEAWMVELAADEGLCDRVQDALPRDLVEEHLEDVDVERGAKFQAFVEHREAFKCAITGNTQTGPALVLVGRGFAGRELSFAGFGELVVSVATLRELLGEQ